MKHCCVIGGAGFLGSYVVNLLSATDRHVSVIGRSPHPRKPLPANVTYHSCDIANEGALSKALSGADEIIDLAYSSAPKASFDDPLFDMQSNLSSAVCLFRVAASLSIRKMILVSSGGTVYGKTEVPSICESHLTNPISPYGITKLAIEKYGLMYCALNDLPLVIVRPSNAYGPGQLPFVGQGFVATAIASVLQGAPISLFGNEGTVRDYIHVADVAQGIIGALDHGVIGNVYNIGSNIGRSNLEVIDALRPLAAQRGMSVQINVLPERKFDVPRNVLNSQKLSDHTGWRSEVLFVDGLKATWDSLLCEFESQVSENSGF